MRRHSGKYVAYYRVSTDRQARSGLGLEAQKEAVRQSLNGGQWELAGEFIETESGKRSDRPELTKALAMCRLTNATLVVAKLDRLARNAEFLRKVVRESGERGVMFCDLPNISEGPQGKFLIGIMAEVAELEAGMISQRTKAALAAAKARGTVLGTQDPQRIRKYAKQGRLVGLAVRRAKAAERMADILPQIEAIKAEGAKSLNEIADALNKKGITAARGGKWQSGSIHRLLARTKEAA